MKIQGIDFTSVPDGRKPITCAGCNLDAGTLLLEEFEVITSFEAFEELLRRPGPWVAGLDFPFGQPRKLIDNLGWPKAWEAYVRYLAAKSKPEFVELLRVYREARPAGDKQHLRRTDQAAKSRSPMMLFGVPVGKMFFEGASRLLVSGASVLPCRPSDDPRVIVEAYPALVARRWIGNRAYKNDEPRKQSPAQRSAREDIIRGLGSEAKKHFGFDVQFDDEWAEASVEDGSGDRLDALLCAVQAGWAYSKRDRGFGIPSDCDPLEGWIVDPAIIAVKTAVDEFEIQRQQCQQ